MNNLLNQLQEAIDTTMMRTYKQPIKINVTSDFANYLKAQCPYDVIYTKDDSPRGYTPSIFGIPFEVDNTIEDPFYKIIYEEN